MATLARAVHVTDPTTHRPVVLQPGEEPAPHLAALITSPAAWVDGILPGAEDDSAGSGQDQLPDPAAQPKPEAVPAPAKKTAAKKTAAKKPPAPDREAASEGDGSQ
jgi:hypothetical protein